MNFTLKQLSLKLKNEISEMLCFRTLQQSIAVGKSLKNVTSLVRCNYVSYVQGQSPEPGIREYFYYIDHQGMVLKNYIFQVKKKYKKI